MSESPLEETANLSTVIDLAEVRIARGETSAKERVCEHRNILYSTNERRIWCKDCQRTIDGFDGFLIFAKNFTAMMADAENKVSAANAALAHATRLRATKQLDRIWSGNVMAVGCPHCKGGLLPEDFANGATSAWSRELEMARRNSSQEK